MPASNKEFKMPPIEVGRNVVWYANGRKKDCGASANVVTRLANNLDLQVFHRDRLATHPVDGVPHIDDPVVQQRPHDERGAWDYTDEDKRRMAWERDVESRLAALEKPPLKKAS